MACLFILLKDQFRVECDEGQCLDDVGGCFSSRSSAPFELDCASGLRPWGQKSMAATISSPLSSSYAYMICVGY